MKRWMAILAVSVALGYGVRRVFGQPGQPTAAEKKSATTIILPPSPKALLPDVFDGWVTSEPSKVLTDPSQADSANAAALKEYGFTTGLEASYKREGETVTLARSALRRRQRSLRRLLLLPAEWLAQRDHRHGRSL